MSKELRKVNVLLAKGRHISMERAIALLRTKEISIGKAAQLCNMDREAFEIEISKRKIPVIVDEEISEGHGKCFGKIYYFDQ